MASSTTTSSLAEKHSHPIKPGTPALAAEKISEYSGALPGWIVKDGTISKTFNFKNYYETMAFVNAIAWVAHHEDHHPDLEVGYNRCKVTYSTHSVGGLSENDFICAAKVERLMR
jgi:4a-hydroxytetrahydrobiopterin dehydratase